MASCYACGHTLIGKLQRREVVTSRQRRFGVRGQSTSTTTGIRSLCEPCAHVFDRKTARLKFRKDVRKVAGVATALWVAIHFWPGQDKPPPSASQSVTAYPDTKAWHPTGWSPAKQMESYPSLPQH